MIDFEKYKHHYDWLLRPKDKVKAEKLDTHALVSIK